MATERADFGQFTPAERRAALVHLTAEILVRATPRHYPPNRSGEQKAVKKGSEASAAAFWAKRTMDSIEYAIRPDTEGARDAQEGRSNETPF